MKCPNCGSQDAFEGFLGWDCINAGCKYFKNGKSTNSKVTGAPFQARIENPPDGPLHFRTLPDGVTMAFKRESWMDPDTPNHPRFPDHTFCRVAGDWGTAGAKLNAENVCHVYLLNPKVVVWCHNIKSISPSFYASHCKAQAFLDGRYGDYGLPEPSMYGMSSVSPDYAARNYASHKCGVHELANY